MIQEMVYRLVSTDFVMILDIALSVFPPDDQMIFVRFEELCNILGPCFNSVKSFLAEYTCEVTLDSSDRNRSEIVTKDPKR